MKISLTSLQQYFEKPLPAIAEVADAFTFHSFEIDSIEGEVLDVKVLPNRAGDCATPEGVARQLAAILDLPLAPAFVSTALGTTQILTSAAEINATLGSSFSKDDVEGVFRRLRFTVTNDGDTYIITPPIERTDLTIPIDIAEEVGQILGYDRVPAIELPPLSQAPDQDRYRGMERMKDQLVEQGFIEVSTQSFAQKGDIELANPLDKSKPFLRRSLEENLSNALERAKQHAPLVLGPNVTPKLFEVGTVFPKDGEYMELRMTEKVEAWGAQAATVDNLSVAKLEEYGKGYEPTRYTLSSYKPFSVYPFTTRDLSLWAPTMIDDGLTKSLIQEHTGELLVRIDLFDRFEKEGKVSLAFRLVFQAMDRTLTDSEVNTSMQKISAALTAKGYDIR